MEIIFFLYKYVFPVGIWHLITWDFNTLYWLYLSDYDIVNISIESYIFKGIQGLSIFGALGCALVIPVWLNPVYSLLSLILVFLLSVIYLSFLKVKFLSLIYILVYIGAIVILFLFMIMLLSLETPFYNLSLNQFMKLNLLFSIKASIFSVVIVDQGFHKFDVFFFRQYKKNFVANDFIFEFSYFANDSLIFNNLLYTQFFFHFIILGFILLVGMIGSIALTLATKSN